MYYKICISQDKPEEHDEWKKDKRNYRRNKNSSSSSADSESKSSTQKLQLTESMKQALMTDGNMTEDQATALWSKLSEN